MFNVRIVLVETAGALNLGSVARVMKNMGLSQLWLVNPQCDRDSEPAQHMAVHAKDILASAQIVQKLPEALVGCQRAIATAGRISQGKMQLVEPISGLTWLTEVNTSAIVFGSEDRGLSNMEMQYCQQVMQIPVSPDYQSLNLAQAVAICCYQLRLLYEECSIAKILPDNTDSTSQNGKSLLHSACIEMIEAYYEHLESVLLKIGYLYPHTAFSRMQKLRHLFHKSNLTEAEVTMLRGILRQVEWAIAQDSN